jgi:hypothetical protein
MRFFSRLGEEQEKILEAMMAGWTLKSHRYVDGDKIYQLHPLEGEPRQVNEKAVKALMKRGLIYSNQKFPAATYLLTNKGMSLATKLDDQAQAPLMARGFLK